MYPQALEATTLAASERPVRRPRGLMSPPPLIATHNSCRRSKDSLAGRRGGGDGGWQVGCRRGLVGHRRRLVVVVVALVRGLPDDLGVSRAPPALGLLLARRLRAAAAAAARTAAQNQHRVKDVRQ